jgi:hypothetical protein
MVLKNPRSQGGMLLKKSGRWGPYLLKTDSDTSSQIRRASP